MAPEPFYYETDEVWLLLITPEQADVLYLDASLWAEWWGSFCYERRVKAMHGESGLY